MAGIVVPRWLISLAVAVFYEMPRLNCRLNERKLGIACLIHSRANLPSLEALERALLDFPGAILAATHDRWFIDRIATAVWRLRDGRIALEEGTGEPSQDRAGS